MKIDKDILLLDLDGTIFESKEGIFNAIKYMIKKEGIEVPEGMNYDKFIGPPLKYSFMKYLNMSEKDSESAIESFREYYETKGLFENHMYEGMPEFLEKAHAAGKKLVLATSKPENVAKRIFEKNDITKHFYFLAGAVDGINRTDKVDVLNYILSSLKDEEKSNMIMIGDTVFDVEGANLIGVDSIAVTYGYGNLEDIKKHKPTYIVNTVKELEDLFL